MRITAAHAWLPVGALLLAVACGRGKDKSDRPPRPSDGTPVVVKFLSLTGNGKRMGARVKAYSYVDEEITKMQLSLRYLDAAGNELKIFPWGTSASLAANGSATLRVGAFLPPATEKVDAKVRTVVMKSGQVWRAQTALEKK